MPDEPKVKPVVMNWESLEKKIPNFMKTLTEVLTSSWGTAKMSKACEMYPKRFSHLKNWDVLKNVQTSPKTRWDGQDKLTRKSELTLSVIHSAALDLVEAHKKFTSSRSAIFQDEESEPELTEEEFTL